MSAEDKMEPLEEKLRELTPRKLPGEWRGEILDTALGAAERTSPREVIAALFPRPLTIGLAAAWMLILGLRATMPGGGGESRAVEGAGAVPHDVGEVCIAAIAERVRVNVTGELESNGSL